MGKRSISGNRGCVSGACPWDRWCPMRASPKCEVYARRGELECCPSIAVWRIGGSAVEHRYGVSTAPRRIFQQLTRCSRASGPDTSPVKSTYSMAMLWSTRSIRNGFLGNGRRFVVQDTSNVGCSAVRGSPGEVEMHRAAGCVRCESRASEGCPMDLIRGTQRRGNRLGKRADGEPPWRLSGRRKARGERGGVRDSECRRGEPRRDGAAGDERGAQRRRESTTAVGAPRCRSRAPGRRPGRRR